MTARIAEVIAEHRSVGDEHECHCGWRGEYWADHVAQAIREERTVRTAEELDALGDAVIRDVLGDVWEHGADGKWHWGDHAVPSEELFLRARVLWTPGDEQ